MIWTSEVKIAGSVGLPNPSGQRILMMPFLLNEPWRTLPPFLNEWKRYIDAMVGIGPMQEGVGYLTIDERFIRAGQVQRRPGLHVDGWKNDGEAMGLWGGGGTWGSRGLLMVASHYGCDAYAQNFEGEPTEYGNCEHLRQQCKPENRVECKANIVYHMDAMTVHESVPTPQTTVRQFVRISMPSDGGWPDNCTPNPLGILPRGPVISPRPTEFTNYVPRKGGE